MNGTIERHGHYIARAHCAAGRINALPINADMSRSGKRGRRRPRAHNPRMPQPLIDTLPVQGRRYPSARLFGLRLEPLLELCELGKRRIRVGLPIALSCGMLSPFDIFGAQSGIAVWSITP